MQDTQPYRRPRQAQAARVRRSTRREREPVNWRRRLKLSSFLILAVAVTAVVLLAQRAIAFNDAVSTESALSMRLFGPFAPERVNILVLGYGDETQGGAFLSDSMNIMSVDSASGTTSIIPLPRDLWVEGVAAVPQNMKINEAFRIGYYHAGIEYAAQLASEVAEHVTGLDIQGWISLDFQGFEAMVEAVNGISVDNPTAFSYTWAEEDYSAGNFQYTFPAGTLELSGQQALDYARNRYTSVAAESSDFARLARQQRIIQALRAKVDGWQSLPGGLALADALSEHLHTNLSVLDLAMFVGKSDIDRRVELKEGEILAATTNTIGQYVLVVNGRESSTDYEPLHTFLRTQLDAVPETNPTEGGAPEP